MAKTKYRKLVRDKIPKIIENTGKTCVTEVLADEEYLQMLDMKLEEELQEYYQDKSLEELADLMEVIFAVAEARGYSIAELEQERKKKVYERGGFKQKILLKEVTDPQQ